MLNVLRIGKEGENAGTKKGDGGKGEKKGWQCSKGDRNG